MLRIGANAKLVAGAPGIEVIFGTKGRQLHCCELPLYEFDALVDAMIKQRDDAHAFFQRAGVLPPPPAKNHHSPPKIRLVPPSGARAEEFVAGLPTPLLPPPLDEKKS